MGFGYPSFDLIVDQPLRVPVSEPMLDGTLKAIRMPRVDPAMEKGIVVKWVKKQGDQVKEGEHLVTIMTDKVEFEVPSPCSGILQEVIADEGSETPVGEPIANLVELGEVYSQPKVLTVEKKEMKISPAARRLAEEHKINISNIQGTGPEGRIIREDILRLIGTSTEAISESYKSIKISPMRRIIAQRMVLSHQTIPPVTLTMVVDAEQLTRAKKSLNVSYDVIFVKVLAQALSEFEIFNSNLADNELRVMNELNICVAVATEDGLIVPVVKNANKKTLQEISQDVNALTEKARNGQLTVKEVSGGTFTLSNLGMYGIETFTPIITPGQAAILGVGCVLERAVVQEGKVVIKPQINLSFTFDHRIADGAVAARFLARLRQLIEEGLYD